jgi:hypothetical protein
MIAVGNLSAAPSFPFLNVIFSMMAVLLAVAHGGMIHIPHAPEYTIPRTSSLQDKTNCNTFFSSIDMEGPYEAALNGESLRPLPMSAKVQSNSQTGEDELVIGRFYVETNVVFPRTSGPNQDHFDVEAAAELIGRIDIIFCYRQVETPTDSSSQPPNQAFSCLHELRDSFLFRTNNTHDGWLITVSADLVVPRSKMIVKENVVYAFHVFAESADGCSSASPSRFFQVSDINPITNPSSTPAAVPKTHRTDSPKTEHIHDSSCVIEHPRHGSMMFRDKVRLIIAFNETDIQSNAERTPNAVGSLVLSCLVDDDALYTVNLNQRLLKSFHSKNAIFENGTFTSWFVRELFEGEQGSLKKNPIVSACL